ncbi:hypothetical protein D9M72_598630 [compost metagenome]
MNVEAKPTVRPTSSELRAPWMVRARTSCPLAVVPNQNSASGSWEAMPVILEGLPGYNTGASSAKAMKMNRMAAPVMAFLLVSSPCSRVRLGLRTEAPDGSPAPPSGIPAAVPVPPARVSPGIVEAVVAIEVVMVRPS